MKSLALLGILKPASKAPRRRTVRNDDRNGYYRGEKKLPPDSKGIKRYQKSISTFVALEAPPQGSEEDRAKLAKVDLERGR